MAAAQKASMSCQSVEPINVEMRPITRGFLRSQAASEGFNRLVRYRPEGKAFRRLRWASARRARWHSGAGQNVCLAWLRWLGTKGSPHARQFRCEAISPDFPAFLPRSKSPDRGRKSTEENPRRRRRKKSVQRILRRKPSRKKIHSRPSVLYPFHLNGGTQGRCG